MKVIKSVYVCVCVYNQDWLYPNKIKFHVSSRLPSSNPAVCKCKCTTSHRLQVWQWDYLHAKKYNTVQKS